MSLSEHYGEYLTQHQYNLLTLDLLERIAVALERAHPEEKHVDITRFMEGNPLATAYRYGQKED